MMMTGPVDRKTERERRLRERREKRDVTRRVRAATEVEEPPVDEFTPHAPLFFSAAKDGDAKTVRKLVENKEVHVNTRNIEDPLQPTALLVACEHRHYDVIEALLERDPRAADINLGNNREQKPIWWAARYGDVRIAELLLEGTDQTCDVNYLDMESGCTPLYRSILSNSTGVCAALIHAGADVNLRRLGISGDAAHAESPLIKAVQLNNMDIVDMLINSLCDMDARTKDGLTALHYAVAYRRYAITKKLLVNKIPIKAQSKRGVTAMTVAIKHHNPVMIQLLVEHGYNPDQPFEWGETPLEMAIKNHSELCALALVFEGCSLEVPCDKPSYFLLAISEGLVNLVKVLVEIRPGYLSEEWLRHRYIPLALYKFPYVYESLFDMSSSPRPLSKLCRSVIYASLDRYPQRKATELPLPKKLQNFVTLKKDFPREMFEETTIYTDDCPYDCDFDCRKIQCPELDFSSSSDDLEFDIP